MLLARTLASNRRRLDISQTNRASSETGLDISQTNRVSCETYLENIVNFLSQPGLQHLDQRSHLVTPRARQVTSAVARGA